MKTIAPAAMAAIEAGEAIVTGAVEIIPRANSAVLGTVELAPIFPQLNQGDPTYPMAPGDYPATVSFGPYSSDAEIRVVGLLTLDDYLTINGVSTGPVNRPADALLFELPAGDTVVLGVHNSANTITLASGTVRAVASSGDSSPIRLWGGYGPIEIDGETYQGIGDHGLAQQTAGAVGGVAQGLALTLSGIEPEVLPLLDAEEIRGASAVVRRLIFASDGRTMLDHQVFDRGRVDAVDTEEVIGAGAAVKLSVESAARGLGRSGARQRSDSDQRLINPADGYFRLAAYAFEKMLYWGGRKPNRMGSI